MRVLFVDVGLNGHREKYISTLCNSIPDAIAQLPVKSSTIINKQITIDFDYYHKRTLKSYLIWLKEIEHIVQNEKADAVHFLCGDEFYRYFGLGLEMFDVPVYMTFHHMLFSFPRRVSITRIFKRLSLGIVHTDCLQKKLEEIGIENSKKIEYPVFDDEIVPQKEARKSLGLDIENSGKYLLALGATAYYKGLDILLEALNDVKEPFHLLIAGEPTDFSENYIQNAISPYRDKVTLLLHHLDNTEYKQCLAASDIIVLPYRQIFNGASGPMLEGVWSRKTIIGSSHGSMGDIVQKNELGAVFEPENAKSLAAAINKMLQLDCVPGDKACDFRNSLSKAVFCRDYFRLYY